MKRILLAAPVLVGVVAISACSSGSGHDASGDTAGPVAASVPTTANTLQISYDGVPTGLLSVDTLKTDVYFAQSGLGGSIYTWRLKDLPKSATGSAGVKPSGSWKPPLPDKVKMEGIAFSDKKGQGKDDILITRKATNVNATGGNSVWSYDYGADEGQHLAGNTAPAGNGYYTWGPAGSWKPLNSAGGAINYTEHNFPTDAPTKVSIGDGGGVVRADNGYLYYGSLQSGCVYKQDEQNNTAESVHCTTSWGSGGQNASIYALTEDDAGHVYAAYQGAKDIGTTILRITPGGAKPDTVEAIQLDGYLRTAGVAVSPDGAQLWAGGIDVARADTTQPDLLLSVKDPTWGTPESPGRPTPNISEVPGEAVWLNGMLYFDKKNPNLSDVLLIANNSGGFFMVFDPEGL